MQINSFYQFFGKKRQTAFLVFILLFFGVLLTTPSARADLFSIGEIANKAVGMAVLYFQGIVLGFLGTVLSYQAEVLGWILKFQGKYLISDITIVRTSWTVFRDFSNMFFILVLIIIAFATIFDVQRYNWKGLIARFLIVALLINFSLPICEFVINIATTLSNVMLNQFSDITGNLAGGFGLNKLITGTEVGSAAAKAADPEKALVSTIISFSGITIIVVVVNLVFLVVLVFSFVRIPLLWALMIVSPIAWIAAILPATRSHFETWKKWFLGWTFFMPLYLFSLTMGLVILANRPDLETAAQLTANQTVPVLSRVGNFFGFAFQDIFYYALTVVILIGGLMISLKASFLTGTGVGKTFGAINGYFQRKTGVAGLPGTWQRIKEEGLPERLGKFSKLYTGSRGAQKETAKWEQAIARRLGYTPDLKMQKQQVSEIDTEVGRLKDLERAGQLAVDNNFVTQTLATDRTSTRGLAMRKLLAERGMSDRTDAIQTYTELAQRNPFLAQSLAEAAGKGDHANLPVGDVIQMAAADPGGPFAQFSSPQSTSTRKEWLSWMKKNDRALSSPEFTYARFEKFMSLLGGPTTNEGKEFRKEVSNKRPDIVAEYDYRNFTPAPGVTTPADITEALYRIINKKNVSGMAEILRPAMGTEFRNALLRMLEEKQQNNQADPALNYRGAGAEFKRNLMNELGDPGRATVVRSVRSLIPAGATPGPDQIP